MNRPAIVFFLIPMLFYLFPSPATLQEVPLEKFNDTHQFEIQGATGTRIVDGDTIEIEHGSMKERVPCIDIDTPERGKPFYKGAKEYNEQPLGDNLVTLKMDVQLRDKYARLVAYVYLTDEKGTFVNAKLVKAGCAQVMTLSPNVKHSEFLLRMMRVSREKEEDLWWVKND